MEDFRTCHRIILDELSNCLSTVNEEDVRTFMLMLDNAERVFFVGVGRVLLSLQAMAKRFYHLGIDTHIVGDITEPAITDRDLLIVGSGSGESKIPVAIAQIAAEKGVHIVHIGSNPLSSLAPITSLMIRIPVQTKLYLEDEIKSQQVMSSLFEQSLLIFGDAVALMWVRQRQIDLHELWQYHANLE